MLNRSTLAIQKAREKWFAFGSVSPLATISQVDSLGVVEALRFTHNNVVDFVDYQASPDKHRMQKFGLVASDQPCRLKLASHPKPACLLLTGSAERDQLRCRIAIQ